MPKRYKKTQRRRRGGAVDPNREAFAQMSRDVLTPLVDIDALPPPPPLMSPPSNMQLFSPPSSQLSSSQLPMHGVEPVQLENQFNDAHVSPVQSPVVAATNMVYLSPIAATSPKEMDVGSPQFGGAAQEFAPIANSETNTRTPPSVPPSEMPSPIVDTGEIPRTIDLPDIDLSDLAGFNSAPPMEYAPSYVNNTDASSISNLTDSSVQSQIFPDENSSEMHGGKKRRHRKSQKKRKNRRYRRSQRRRHGGQAVIMPPPVSHGGFVPPVAVSA